MNLAFNQSYQVSEAPQKSLKCPSNLILLYFNSLILQLFIKFYWLIYMNFFSQPQVLRSTVNQNKTSQKGKRLTISINSQRGIKKTPLSYQTNDFQKQIQQLKAKDSYFSFMISPCQPFCGISQQNRQNVKSQVLFDDSVQEEQDRCSNNQLIQQRSRKLTLNLHELSDYSSSCISYCPETPINKILHIDQDINQKRLKTKGIMLISPLIRPQDNEKKYESTNVSNRSSTANLKIN